MINLYIYIMHVIFSTTWSEIDSLPLWIFHKNPSCDAPDATLIHNGHAVRSRCEPSRGLCRKHNLSQVFSCWKVFLCRINVLTVPFSRNSRLRHHFIIIIIMQLLNIIKLSKAKNPKNCRSRLQIHAILRRDLGCMWRQSLLLRKYHSDT
jgi:hypothetical protein